MERLGFQEVDMQLPVLKQMEGYQLSVMFIGLVFDILLILFVIVAILLIYSLLLISVETKQFDIGVMRTLGLDSYGFFGLVLL